MTVLESERPQRVLEGIAFILGSVLMMGFADALVKLASADMTLWQVFFARSLIGIGLMLGAARFLGSQGTLKALLPRSVYWTSLRSLLLVLTWLCFYASLPVLNLSIAAVAAYTNPIITALLSALLIGEPVSKRQWAGILLGFLGVVTVLQPGTGDFSWFTVLPLMAAVLYSLAMILTRSKCRDERPIALALSLHGGFLISGLIATVVLAILGLADDTKVIFPFLLGDWAPMGWPEWGVMALLAALSGLYMTGVAHAYQIAPPSTVATFDYGYLLSVALWGFVFFAERPGAMTLAGMALITGAGLLVAAPSRRRSPRVG